MYDLTKDNPMFKKSDLQAKERLGQIVVNKQGEKMKIIEYRNAKDVDIQFLDTNNIVYHQYYGNFVRGTTVDKFLPTVFDHGIVGNEIIQKNGVYTDEYLYWSGMLKRCYNEVDLANYPTYKKCEVEKEWFYLSNFTEWFNDNYYKCGYEKMCLDKDILYKNNTLYSKDTCVFVPERINILFTKTNAKRGEYPIGVTYKKKNRKFAAQISKLDNNIKNTKHVIHIGLFDTPEEAFYAYKIEKEKYIKEVADYYKNKYDNFPRHIYEALYNYNVEITD